MAELNDYKGYLRDEVEHTAQKSKGKFYICPLCGSGTGAINRGADLFFSANDAEAQEAQQPYKAQEASQEQLASTVQDMQAYIEAQETWRTQGRKGLKMPRMNMCFTPSNMDYLKIMAGVNGMTITRFMNYLIEQHAEANAARYQKAKEIMRDE